MAMATSNFFLSFIFFFALCFAAGSPPPHTPLQGTQPPPPPSSANTDLNGYYAPFAANLGPPPPAANYHFDPLAAPPPPASVNSHSSPGGDFMTCPGPEQEEENSYKIPPLLKILICVVGGGVLSGVLFLTIRQCSNLLGSGDAPRKPKPETETPDRTGKRNNWQTWKLPEVTLSLPQHCPSCGHAAFTVHHSTYAYCSDCGFRSSRVLCP